MADPIQQLRELAEKATPGPWLVRGGRTDAREMLIYGGSAKCYRIAEVFDANGLPENRANAAYIAAASPDYVLKLLEVVQRAKYVARSNGFDAALPEKMDALRSSLEALERA